MRLDEKLKVIYETIAPTITRSEEAWKGYLRFGSAVYKHNFDNTLLVYAQNPKATMLATFDTWKNPKVGRSINKGESGIAVCEYANASLTIKHLFDVTQTNGKTIPAVWKLDDGLRKGLLNRLTYGKSIKADTLADCIGQIVDNAVAGKADEFMRGFENEIKGHFFGNLPKDGLTAEIEEIIAQSCKYFIISRCGIETDGIQIPTISHFDTIPLISRLGYTVTEISKGILLEIERSVKILESERSAQHEQRTIGEPRVTRPHPQLGDRGRAGTTARQVRQDGDGISAQHQPAKVFTFEDAGRAFEPDVQGGRGSGGASGENHTEALGERPDAADRRHTGTDSPLEQTAGHRGGNRDKRDGIDTEITEPEKEPQGSFSLGDYLTFDGKPYMLTHFDDKGYVIRSLDEKSKYHNGNADQYKDYTAKGYIRRTHPAELNKLFGFAADEIIWFGGEEYIIDSFDTRSVTLKNLIDNSVIKTLPVIEACEILWTENAPVQGVPLRLFSAPQIWYTPNKKIPYREGDIVRSLSASARVLQITGHAVRYLMPEETEQGPYSMERTRFEENLESGVYRTIMSGDTERYIGPAQEPALPRDTGITIREIAAQNPHIIIGRMPPLQEIAQAAPEASPIEPPDGSFFMPAADDESIIKEDLLKGSMTRGGKTRIRDFVVNKAPKTADLARFLKNEYGTSSHSGNKDAGVLFVDYNSAGIQIRVRDNDAENGERQIKLTWNGAAKRVAALVNNGEYLPESEGTPLWRQYNALLYEYPDSIVFKRLGDFYEVMGWDANKVAAVFGLTPTSRDVGLAERVPLIGIPAHNIDTVIKELVNKDYSVVMADAEGEIEHTPAEKEQSDEEMNGGLDDYAIPDEPESYGSVARNKAEQQTFEQMRLDFVLLFTKKRGGREKGNRDK